MESSGKLKKFLCALLSVCYSRPSHVRRSAFTRSPLKKSASGEVARVQEKFTSPIAKTSPARGSGSPASSGKKRSSVDKTTPRSSRAKISSADTVTRKSADCSSVSKSAAAEPQVTNRSEKNSSNSKQKIDAGKIRDSTAFCASPSSSRKTSDSLTKTPKSGADKATGSKSAEAGIDLSDLKTTEMEMELELKGKRATQQSSTKVVSARQKQPISSRQDSRPASRISVYVSLLQLLVIL